MDKLNYYRQLIEQVLTEHSQRQPFNGEIEVQLLLNQQQADYQVWYLGWDGDDRIHHCLIHVRLKNSKIWVENDDTEVGIANELIEQGVPQQEIVLAYHAPYLRHFSEFAVS